MTPTERAWITLQCRLAIGEFTSNRPVLAVNRIYAILDELAASDPDAPDPDEPPDSDDDAHNCPRGEVWPKMPTVGEL